MLEVRACMGLPLGAQAERKLEFSLGSKKAESCF